MFCNKCGNELKEGAAFCSKCGAQVGGAAVRGKTSGGRTPAALRYAIGGAAAAVLVAVIATVIIVAGRAVYQRSRQDDGKTASAEEASAENYAADDYAADDYAADAPTEDTAAAAEASSLGGGLYEVTPDNVSNMLAEFFLLHLGCYIDYCGGNCSVEPENISSMMEHTGVIGLFTVADGMRIADNYTEGLFSMKLKGSNLSSLLRGNSQVEYGCTVEVTDINFAGSSFRYYEGTSANISAIVRLHYFVNGTEASFQNNYAMVNLVNNSGNPKDWLLTMAFFIDENDYLNTKSQGDVFDNYLVNEDGSRTDAGADIGAESREAADTDYILPDSNTRYLTREDLAGLSAEECRIARNEIYARHGRRFKDEELQSYFNGKDWYAGTTDEVTDDMLNAYELANRDLIMAYEEEQGYR